MVFKMLQAQNILVRSLTTLFILVSWVMRRLDLGR